MKMMIRDVEKCANEACLNKPETKQNGGKSTMMVMTSGYGPLGKVGFWCSASIDCNGKPGSLLKGKNNCYTTLVKNKEENKKVII
jgi:hypothetical protein